MSKQPTAPFLHDLKRMAPVWGVVVATAIIVALTMRQVGQAQLEQASTLSRNACNYAQVLFNAGYQRMNSVRELAGERRLQGESLDEPALGLLRGNERLASVKERFVRALELCPSLAEAHRSLAVLAWYEGNASEAYYHLASWQMNSNRLTEARVHFEMAREANPESREALLGLVDCLLRLGRVADARQQVTGQEELMQRSPRGTLLLGELLYRERRFEEAAGHLRAGLVQYPVDRNAVATLYRIGRDTGDPRATADFLLGLGDHGERTITEAYDLAGSLYSSLEDHAQAEVAYRRALQLFPNNVDILFKMSMTLYRQGKYSEARDMARQAIDHDVARVMERIAQSGVDPRRPPS